MIQPPIHRQMSRVSLDCPMAKARSMNVSLSLLQPRSSRLATSRLSLLSILLASVFLGRLAPAQQLMSDADRNFDSYPIGTAPDIDQFLGGWKYPAKLAAHWEGDSREKYDSLFSIVDTSTIDPTRTGHSLAIIESRKSGQYKYNALQYVLDPIIPEGEDGFVRFNFEAYVRDVEGQDWRGYVDLSGDHGFGGISTQTDLGTQLGWTRNGDLEARSCRPGTDCNGSQYVATKIVSDFPKDQWQQIQVDYDMKNDQYDVYSAPEGEELQLIGEDLRIRSQNQTHLDFITISSLDEGGEAYLDNFSLEFISTLPAVSISGANGVYQQNFDEALGVDGARNQPMPTGWAGGPNSDRGFDVAMTRSFPAGRTPSGTLLLGAGGDDDPDRALAIGVGRSMESGTIQFLADVTGANANTLQLAFDLEAWDAGTGSDTADPGVASFQVTVDIDSGDGFQPFLDLGRVATGELQPPTGDYLDGNDPANRIAFDSGLLSADIPVGSQLRFQWTVDNFNESRGWVFGVDNFSLSLFSELLGDLSGNGVLDVDDLNALTVAIQSGSTEPQYDVDGSGMVDLADRQHWVTNLKQTWLGDANLDGVFDSGDLVAAFSAGEYEDTIIGNSTWSTGDWNGDAEFDSGDLVEAFGEGGYEAGPRAAVTAVPEPASVTTAVAGLLALMYRRRRQA